MVRDDPVMLAVPKADLSTVPGATIVARELLEMIRERTKGIAPMMIAREQAAAEGEEYWEGEWE